MGKEQFWKKSYDPGLTDIDPCEWETTYVEAIKNTFEKFPSKAALAYMGTHITFAELDKYANQFANMLCSHGLQKGDVVGINLPNIPEYVIAWLGTLRAGCAVSGVSPLLSPEEMEYQLKDSHAKGLVTLDAIFAGRLVKIASNLPELKVVVAASIGGFLPAIKRVLGKLLKKFPTGEVTPLKDKRIYRMEDVIKKGQFPADPPQVNLTPDDIAYIQYTGGTTGLPKGAMLTHRNAVSDLLIVQKWLGWERGKGLALSGFPFFHIAGLFFNENCIYLGWTQVLIPNPRDTDHICAELVKYKPTSLVNVPSLFLMLIDNPKFKTLDFSNLDTCISAAAPFPEEAQKKLEDIVGKGKLLEVYGMTETSPLTTMNPYKGKKKLGSIGLPLLNTDIRLLEPGTGREVEVGQPGEICVKGPQIMVGYYNKPEETKMVIDKDDYLHTGDVAVQDEEGYLRIVDRTKDMIIVGGYKVFSRKVEEVLSEHPAIGAVALIGILNPERPGSELVKAYITMNPGYQFDGNEEALKGEIFNFAKAKLAPYEIPKTIEIRKELPLTSVGKVDKKVLRKETTS
jgi:long-chain acyl-CoA synthetase